MSDEPQTQTPASDHLWFASQVLLWVGGLTALFSAFVMFGLRSELIEKELTGPTFQDHTPEQLQEAAESLRRVYFRLDVAGVAVGLSLCLLGWFVRLNPVAMTLCGLLIFSGWQFVLAGIDWGNLLQGWVTKLVFLYSLISAIRSALAYERDRMIGVGTRPSEAAQVTPESHTAESSRRVADG